LVKVADEIIKMGVEIYQERVVPDLEEGELDILIEHSDGRIDKKKIMLAPAPKSKKTSQVPANKTAQGQYKLKLDVDTHLSEKSMKLWKKTRLAILKSLDYKVIEMNFDESEKGFHVIVLIKSSEKLSPEKQCFLQVLLGSDLMREKLNMARIGRGIDWNRANRLFSKVIWRRPKSYERNRMIEIVKKIKNPEDKRFMEKTISRFQRLEELYRDVIADGSKKMAEVE